MRNMAKFAGSIITVCITFLISLAETEIIDLSSSSTYQWEAALRNGLRIWGGGMYEFNEFYRVPTS